MDADEPVDERTLCECSSSLMWKFEETQPHMNGPRLIKPRKQWCNGNVALKSGASATFKCPFECFQLTSGLDHNSVARLARNSNRYSHDNVKDKLGKNDAPPFALERHHC